MFFAAAFILCILIGGELFWLFFLVFCFIRLVHAASVAAAIIHYAATASAFCVQVSLFASGRTLMVLVNAAIVAALILATSASDFGVLADAGVVFLVLFACFWRGALLFWSMPQQSQLL